MMRFSEFILLETFDSKEGLKKIKEDCQYFLNMTSEPLFRGIKLPAGNEVATRIMYHPHPVDRAPKDSDYLFNSIFNYGFEKAFGIKDVRTKSLYVTGNFVQARQFAEQSSDVYLIFPVGKFDFVYAPDYSDIWEDANKFYVNLTEAFTKFMKFYAKDIHELTDMKSFTFKSIIRRAIRHNDTGFDGMTTLEVGKALIESIETHEYDFDINALEAVKKQLGPEKLGKCFEESVGEFVRKIYKKNQDIEKAMSNQIEISIISSGGYYTVPIGLARRTLNSKFGLSPASVTKWYPDFLEEIEKS